MPITDQEKLDVARQMGVHPAQLSFAENDNGDLVVNRIPTESRSALNVGLRGLADAAVRSGITTLAARAGMAGAGALGIPSGPGALLAAGGGLGLGLGAGHLLGKYAYDPLKRAVQGLTPAQAAAQEARDTEEHPLASVAGQLGGFLVGGGRPPLSKAEAVKDIGAIREAAARMAVKGVAPAQRAADAATVLGPAVGLGVSGVEVASNPGGFDPTTLPGAANLANLAVGAASTRGPLAGSLVKALSSQRRPPVLTPQVSEVPVGDQVVTVPPTREPAKGAPVIDISTGLAGAPLADMPTVGTPTGSVPGPATITGKRGRLAEKPTDVPSTAEQRYAELLAGQPTAVGPRRVFISTPSGAVIEGTEGQPLNPMQRLAEVAQLRAAQSTEPSAEELMKSAFQSLAQQKAAKKRNKLELKRLTEERAGVNEAVAEEQQLADAMTQARGEERNVNAKHARDIEDLLIAKDIIKGSAETLGMTPEEAVYFAENVTMWPRHGLMEEQPGLSIAKVFSRDLADKAATDPAVRAKAQRIINYVMKYRPRMKPVGYPVPMAEGTGEPTVPNPEYNAPPVTERSIYPPQQAGQAVAPPAAPSATAVELRSIAGMVPPLIGRPATAPVLPDAPVPARQRRTVPQFNRAEEAVSPLVQPRQAPPVQTSSTEPVQNLQAQLKAVQLGDKPAMLDTHNQLEGQPVPEGVAWTDIYPDGEEPARMYYNPTKVTAQEIAAAADEGRLGTLLGYSQARKPPVDGDNVAVRAMDAEGNVVHEELVPNTPVDISRATEAARKVGSNVQVTTPETAVAARATPEGQVRIIPNSIISAANKLDPAVGQALQHFHGYRNYLLGTHGDTYIRQLNSLPQAAVDEAMAWRNQMYLDKNAKLPPLSAEATQANAIIGQFMDDWRNLNNSVPGREPIGQNPNYVAHMVNTDVLRSINSDATKRTLNKYMQQYLDFNRQVAASRGQPFDPEDAAKWLEANITATTTGRGYGEFNPLVKNARQYYLPDSMRETNPQRLLERYSQRASRDIARATIIEPQTEVAAKLHIGDERDVINPDAFSEAKAFVYGDQGTSSHKPLYEAITGLQSLANSLGVSTVSQLNNLLADSAARHAAAATVPMDHVAQITGRIRATKDFKQMVDAATKTGRLSPRVGYSALSDEANFRSVIGRGLAKAAYAARTATGSNALEMVNRVFDYTIGEDIARYALETGNQKFIHNYGAGILKGDSHEVMVTKLAGNYMEHMQTSYSGADLPNAMVQAGALSVAGRIQRYGVAAMNRIAADVLKPLKEGNIVPLVSYTLATFGISLPVRTMLAQFFSNSMGSNVTLEDTKQLTANDELELALTVAEMADTAGFMGFASKGLRYVADTARGRNRPVLGDPLATGVINGIARNLVNSTAELQDGVPFEKVAVNALKNGLLSAVQDYRVFDNWMKSPEDIAVKEGQQAKSRFESLTGIGRDWKGPSINNLLSVPSAPARPQLLKNGLLNGEPWAVEAANRLLVKDPERYRQVIGNAKDANILYDIESDKGPRRNRDFLQYLDSLGIKDRILQANRDRQQRLEALQR